MTIDFKYAKILLSVLKNRLQGFALAGGTALSMFYLNHRESYDLDFFSSPENFKKDKIEKIINTIKKELKIEVLLEEEKDEAGFAKVLIYIAKFDKDNEYKIDFVEDNIPLYVPSLEESDGIQYYSIEDIYLRKLFAVTGYVKAEDLVGRDMMLGGRQTAKDFFDLYYLSKEHLPISSFIKPFSNEHKEAFISWHKKYDRKAMKIELIDLKTDKLIDFNSMEKHFEEQKDKILEDQLRGI